MNAVGFRTKLGKPRHPFTKGKVERLVRFVKQNFLAGRVFWNVTELNRAALDWRNLQNNTYHKALSCVPQEVHECSCANMARPLAVDPAIEFYPCPERRISFDGFINYEDRRFGVPYSYKQSTTRVQRKDDVLYIYFKENTRLFFDLVDRRYNKDGHYNMVFTSNKNPFLWRDNFNEDDSLLCSLDWIFDEATVFNIRGKKLEKINLQSGRVKVAAPEGTTTT